MFSRAANLFKKGVISMSYSIPAALGATAGVYCADPENQRKLRRFQLDTNKSKKDLEFYGMAFGFGMIFHLLHRARASEFQQSIDNPNNSKWWRNLVRVTTFPFRLAITEPIVSIPLYFCISFGTCLFFYGQFVLEIQSMMLEDLQDEEKLRQEKAKKKQQK